jgi:hypothetical protein
MMQIDTVSYMNTANGVGIGGKLERVDMLQFRSQSAHFSIDCDIQSIHVALICADVRYVPRSGRREWLSEWRGASLRNLFDSDHEALISGLVVA